MRYIGENRMFSFRGGSCESKPGAVISSSDAAEFGRILSRHFKRFSVGCDGFAYSHMLYALCCGLSECGRDVFICENTDMPSFRFGLHLLAADCGIYVSGNLKLSIFSSSGFPICSRILTEIMNGSPAPPAEKCGKMASSTSFRDIYINNIADSLNSDILPISAGVSCGARSVRTLWQEFFTGEDDSLVFQVSDDGNRVNAYSTESGFISHEKLVMAYAAQLAVRGDTVWLPEDLHYAAGLACGERITRFDTNDETPENAGKQRFLSDPLYMCAHLAADRRSFMSAIRSLPPAATVRREVSVRSPEKLTLDKDIPASGGRIRLTRSGRNRITLLAQSFSNETASELCAVWTEKLRRMDT